MRKLLRISCLEHKTNGWVWSKIKFLVGSQEHLQATVKRRKLAWFGHITSHDSLSKTIPQRTVGGGRRRGNAKWTKSAHARTVHKGPLQKRLQADI